MDKKIAGILGAVATLGIVYRRRGRSCAGSGGRFAG